MVNTLPVSGLLMPLDDQEAAKKKEPVDNVKVAVRIKKMLAEIGEATGETIGEVIDRMLAAELPGEHAAVQPKLKQIRANKARIADLQKQARKAGG